MNAPKSPRDELGVVPRGFRAWFQARRGDLGVALILVGFVILPSALLGMLTWRAIQNERSYLEERLVKSYDRFARGASAEIDGLLRLAGIRWNSELEAAALAVAAGTVPAEVAARAQSDSLFAEIFVLTGPGSVVHPPSAVDLDAPNGTGKIDWQDEETFAAIVARGEELEYQEGDLPRAIAVYREVEDEVASPQLRAIAESYVGRAQLKNGQYEDALVTFRELLRRHPEERDLNKMYLRFLAQYQIASAHEGLDQPREALDALVELHHDLHRRSDAINTVQFSYYSELTQALAARLLSAPGLANPAHYQHQFRQLGDRIKQDVSARYLAEVLDDELRRLITRRRQYSSRVRFLSDHAEGEPFLIAYRHVPDRTGTFVTGLVAAQIDLEKLRAEMHPAMQRHAQDTEEVTLTVRGPAGAAIFGPRRQAATPIALHALEPPFEFWEVAVYLDDVPRALRKIDLRTSLWLALTVSLLLVIVVGAAVFSRRARREVFLARSRTTFVSNVTHELRTPLSSIRMFAEMLEMELQEKGWPRGIKSRVQWAQYLGIIRKESERLGRLIENVLDFSRIEQRRRHWHFAERDLAEVLTHAVESFRPHAEAAQFRLDLEIRGRLPILHLDADALSQVFLNLMSNAVQYSDDTREIRVRAWTDRGAAHVEVADRGIGIAPRDLRKVFDEFYSGRQRMDARNPGGLGLGLTLARAIARAHGGDITVRSTVGRGSTFTVTLPAPAAAELVRSATHPQPVADVPHAVGETS